MIVTAVDDKFLDEAGTLIQSCSCFIPEQSFYLFLVNSSENRVARYRRIHPRLIVEHVHWEYDPSRWRGLMCSARSIPIAKVLEKYGEPTLYLDSDTIVMAPLTGLFNELKEHDLLIQYRPDLEQIGPVVQLVDGVFCPLVSAVAEPGCVCEQVVDGDRARRRDQFSTAGPYPDRLEFGQKVVDGVVQME